MEMPALLKEGEAKVGAAPGSGNIPLMDRSRGRGVERYLDLSDPMSGWCLTNAREGVFLLTESGGKEDGVSSII
jgi:hypothetical protein